MQQAGAFRWCEECAWEDPENPEVVPPPPEEKRTVEATESIGTKDLARMCKARVTELEELLASGEKKYREQKAAIGTELSRLRKIITFCEGTASAAKAKPDGRVTRDPNDSRDAWTCPACGYRTVSRWVARHKAQCPARAA